MLHYLHVQRHLCLCCSILHCLCALKIKADLDFEVAERSLWVNNRFIGFLRTRVTPASAFQHHIPRRVKDLQRKTQWFSPKKLIKSWNCAANHQRNQSFCDHMPLLPDPRVDLTHHKLLNQPSHLLIIHCYFCCGSLAFLKMDGASPAERSMVSITTL